MQASGICSTFTVLTPTPKHGLLHCHEHAGCDVVVIQENGGPYRKTGKQCFLIISKRIISFNTDFLHVFPEIRFQVFLDPPEVFFPQQTAFQTFSSWFSLYAQAVPIGNSMLCFLAQSNFQPISTRFSQKTQHFLALNSSSFNLLSHTCMRMIVTWVQKRTMADAVLCM